MQMYICQETWNIKQQKCLNLIKKNMHQLIYVEELQKGLVLLMVNKN